VGERRVQGEEEEMNKVLEYAKSVAAAVGLLATTVSAALADDAVSLDEVHGVVTAALAVATVVAVWRVPNKPPTAA
jgi:uncharacterized membrane protein (DUF441 family)